MKLENGKTFSIRTLALCVIISICVTLIFTLNTTSSTRGPAKQTDSVLEDPGSHDHENKTELWTCGMHPRIITEEPGLCPICNMELTPVRDQGGENDFAEQERRIAFWQDPDNPERTYKTPEQYTGDKDPVPVYEDQVINGVNISIDPVTEQNMGIRTEKAARGPLVSTVRTYGHITWNETRTAEINLKFDGWIEKLHADYKGRQVKKDEPLFEIYSPELFAAQEEYLSAHKSLSRKKSDINTEMFESARQRLLNFGIGKRELEGIIESGTVKKTLTIRSPFTGIITEKNVVEGAYVNAGTKVFTLSDLSKVWVEAHVYEYEMDRFRKGQEARMTLPYSPGTVFTGKVSYVYPYLQKKTRDVVVRLEFDNPKLALKPDMYANIRIRTTGGKEGLMIPAESVIRSGDSDLVFVSNGKGKFTPREVTLGVNLDNEKIHVLSGLAPGERVVTSGQFLLDSESKLKETINKMMSAKTDEKEASGPKENFFNDMEQENEDDFFKDMEI
ncbi:MAG: efflux RND transporter periplasmic adaptor subunit [Desulfarculaceae bacterium]|nr:efflux RND transporter periplasmic adaptor subunit [Desulfarculaceae bacterium]